MYIVKTGLENHTNKNTSISDLFICLNAVSTPVLLSQFNKILKNSGLDIAKMYHKHIR